MDSKLIFVGLVCLLYLPSIMGYQPCIEARKGFDGHKDDHKHSLSVGSRCQKKMGAIGLQYRVSRMSFLMIDLHNCVTWTWKYQRFLDLTNAILLELNSMSSASGETKNVNSVKQYIANCNTYVSQISYLVILGAIDLLSVDGQNMYMSMWSEIIIAVNIMSSKQLSQIDSVALQTIIGDRQTFIQTTSASIKCQFTSSSEVARSTCMQFISSCDGPSRHPASYKIYTSNCYGNFLQFDTTLSSNQRETIGMSLDFVHESFSELKYTYDGTLLEAQSVALQSCNSISGFADQMVSTMSSSMMYSSYASVAGFVTSQFIPFSASYTACFIGIQACITATVVQIDIDTVAIDAACSPIFSSFNIGIINCKITSEESNDAMTTCVGAVTTSVTSQCSSFFSGPAWGTMKTKCQTGGYYYNYHKTAQSNNLAMQLHYSLQASIMISFSSFCGCSSVITGGSTSSMGSTTSSPFSSTTGSGSTTTGSSSTTTGSGSTTTVSGSSTTASQCTCPTSGTTLSASNSAGTTSASGTTSGAGGSTTTAVGSTTGSAGSTTGSAGSTTGSAGSTTSSAGSTTGSTGSTTSGSSTTSTTPSSG